MITIVEPVIYLYPHICQLLSTHPATIGVFRQCAKLLKNDNCYLSPLLIDDLKREGFLKYQSLEEILQNTIGKKVEDLSCFGKSVLESSIEFQYGNLGCKFFDCLYHKDVICSLFISGIEWNWIVVHPVYFKHQQSGMLMHLWKLLSENIKFESIANKTHQSTDYIRTQMRESFFHKFIHYWISDDGSIEEITKPVYFKKEIIHEKIQVHSFHL